MKKTYNWGIIGAGRIAEKFCTALNIVDNATIYAIASRNETTGNAFKEQFNATVYYNNYLSLVNDPLVDIIYIATPHTFHYQHTMLCLANHKHVVCEKPMSLSAAQTKEMLTLATNNNLFLMEAMWTLCLPVIEKAKEIILAGVIGEIQYIQADFGFSTPFDADSRLYNKSLGGGSLLDVGVYPIALATALLGKPASIHSFAKLTPTGVDEYANLIFQYPNGATAHLFSAITIETPIEARIIGTKGSITIHSPWYMATDFTIYLVDDTSSSFSFPHLCNGFEYEIMEVHKSLDNGLLQNANLPHQLTLAVSEIMDEILNQIGVAYPISKIAV